MNVPHETIRKNHLKIKWLFLMQSFAPLFLLLAIRHFDLGAFPLIPKFIHHLYQKDFVVIVDAIYEKEPWRLIIFSVSMIWFIATFLYMYVFEYLQTAGFTSVGEKIEAIDYHDDRGLDFFASYLLPLIIDIDNLQDFLVFIGMLVFIFIMVWRSSLYYENPVLTIWKYKTFWFRTNTGMEGIGITCGKKINTEKRIKRKQIVEDLYFVYNEN